MTTVPEDRVAVREARRLQRELVTRRHLRRRLAIYAVVATIIVAMVAGVGSALHLPPLSPTSPVRLSMIAFSTAVALAVSRMAFDTRHELREAVAFQDTFRKDADRDLAIERPSSPHRGACAGRSYGSTYRLPKRLASSTASSGVSGIPSTPVVLTASAALSNRARTSRR